MSDIESEIYNEDIICLHKCNGGFQHTPYHRHNGYEIYLLLSGNICFYLGDRGYELMVGDVVIVPPNTGHRMRSTDDGTSEYERIVINIKQPLIERLSSARTDLSSCLSKPHEPIHLSEEDFEKFCHYSGKIHEALKNSRYGDDIAVNAYTQVLLLLIDENCHLAREDRVNLMPSVVRDVMAYIEEHCAESLNSAVIEKNFYVSASHISLLFRQHTGLTLSQYIREAKINKAKELLEKGSSVTEACYDCGFENYSSFIRCFTSMVRESPGRYAKAVKKAPK